MIRAIDSVNRIHAYSLRILTNVTNPKLLTANLHITLHYFDILIIVHYCSFELIVNRQRLAQESLSPLVSIKRLSPIELTTSSQFRHTFFKCRNKVCG